MYKHEINVQQFDTDLEINMACVGNRRERERAMK